MKNAVRNLAYNLWEQAGRPEGRDQEFWLEAERLLVKPDHEAKGKLAPRETRTETAKKSVKGKAAPTERSTGTVSAEAEGSAVPAPATVRKKKNNKT